MVSVRPGRNDGRDPELSAHGVVLGLDADELLNRKKWRTNLEFAIAIADYIEHFYNPARHHSALGHLTPNEFEDLHSPKPAATLS